MSAIPAWATISMTPSFRRTSASRCSAIGKPSAAVDEDRHRALDGELEDRAEALVVEREGLRARVELDPRAPRSRQRRASSTAVRPDRAGRRGRVVPRRAGRASACGRSGRRTPARGRARPCRRRTPARIRRRRASASARRGRPPCRRCRGRDACASKRRGFSGSSTPELVLPAGEDRPGTFERRHGGPSSPLRVAQTLGAVIGSRRRRVPVPPLRRRWRSRAPRRSPAPPRFPSRRTGRRARDPRRSRCRSREHAPRPGSRTRGTSP